MKSNFSETHRFKVLTLKVHEMGFSTRVESLLNNANIYTVGQLIQKEEQDLLKYRGFGAKCLHEVKHKLGQLQLTLGMSIDPKFREFEKQWDLESRW